MKDFLTDLVLSFGGYMLIAWSANMEFSLVSCLLGGFGIAVLKLAGKLDKQ